MQVSRAPMPGSDVSGPRSGATLYMVVGCDTDPDATPRERRVSHPDSLWQGVERGIPALRSALREAGLEDARITWLLRADRQMLEAFGAYAYPAERYRALWQALTDEGHEIGWHPHLWAWSERDNVWYPELGSAELVDELAEAHRTLREMFDIRSVRSGWAYCSNQLMALLADLGVGVDFSALPAQVHVDLVPPRYAWYNDWSITPDRPYRPARHDYRVPGEANSALPILEVPVTPIPVPLGRAMMRLAAQTALRMEGRRRLKRASFPLFRPKRFQTRTITSDPAGVAEGIRRALDDGNEPLFVSYFHTDELLDRDMLGNLVRNLLALRAAAQRAGLAFQPATARELEEIIR